MPSLDLDAALDGAGRILVDTSTLIAFLTPFERVHPLARHLLTRVRDDHDPLFAYYSVVSASEILVRPIRSGSESFESMHRFLAEFPHLTVLPVDLQVAIQAATLRAATGLRLPDALVVASGLLANCEAIVSNDEQWKRRLAPLFTRFRWIYLGDYL
jgi:predicted nucleic acid-binding protein